MQSTWRNRIVGHGEVDPQELVANPRNYRIHPKRQQDVLRGAIDDVGFIRSVTVNRRTGYVLDGHLRVSLALSSGQATLPVEYVELSEEEEAEALAVLDPIAGMAATDAAQLEALVAEIGDADEAVAEFLRENLDALIDRKPAEGLTDPDDVPEPSEQPVTERGDVWLLGEHRVMCGDSTDAENVGELLAGTIPFLTVTDPPYGVEYDAAWRDEAAEKGLIAHAGRRVGKVQNDCRVDWSEAWSLVPSAVIYCWHADRRANEAWVSLEAANYEIRAQIIWAKPRFVISRGHYHWQHEPCWYAVRKGATAGWIGDRSQTTLWPTSLDVNVEGGHSTQKPVELMERAIRNHEGEVYDPFAGTGSTLVAAERADRACYAMEIDPKYVDVICRRYQQYTGNAPVLESSGEAHDFASVSQVLGA